MARHRYKSYSSKSSRSNNRGSNSKGTNNKRWIVLLLVVIVAGLFILKQMNKDDERQVINENENLNTDIENLLSDIDPINLGGGDSSENDRPKSGGDDEQDTGNSNISVVADSTGDGISSGGLSKEDLSKLINQVENDIRNEKIIEARNKLNKILLDYPLSRTQKDRVKSWLAQLSRRWLFSNESLEGDTLTGYYKVKSGDTLSVIARNFKVPVEILMQINGIKDARRLAAGRNIKVIHGPFHTVVHLSKFKMDLFLKEQFIKTYDVGTGKPGHETPTGKWRLKRGEKNDRQPPWPNPETGKLVAADDPEYPLGARWIPIECMEGEGVGRTGFALHGTNEPGTIGTRCSLGCIRLHDRDVIEVYNLLSSFHSTVDILP